MNRAVPPRGDGGNPPVTSSAGYGSRIASAPFAGFVALAAFAIYAAAYFACVYQPGLIRMDDFGYLQGVVETIAAGHPVTNAWLGPYSATLSGMSALAFRATGDFILSTWGLQAVFVLGGAALLYRLFRARLTSAAAAGLALVTATQPGYWHKCSEFSGNVSTMYFAMAALLAYRNRSRDLAWAWFFPLVFLAFANRQNALALLALPAWHLVFDRSMARPQKAWLAAGLMAFAFAALLFHSCMNHSFAQTYALYSGWDFSKAGGILRTWIFGVAAALGFLSLFGLLTVADPVARIQANLRKPWIPFAATAVFWLPSAIGPLPMLSFLTPLVGSLDRTSALQWFLLIVIPCLFWTLDWKWIRFDAPACLVLGFVSISSLRGFWYDFYLLDVALAAFFLGLTRDTPLRPGRFSFLMGVVLLCAHGAWAYGYKILSDKQRISIAAYEHLERAGRLTPAEMTDGTFGYLGWKLFDQYWRHEKIMDLAGYLGYVRTGRAVLEAELPWRASFRRPELPGEEVLAEGRTRIGFFPARYRIRDLHDTASKALCEPALVLDPANYRRRPFPLDNKEWSAYVEDFRKHGGTEAGGP